MVGTHLDKNNSMRHTQRQDGAPVPNRFAARVVTTFALAAAVCLPSAPGLTQVAADLGDEDKARSAELCA